MPCVTKKANPVVLLHCLALLVGCVLASSVASKQVVNSSDGNSTSDPAAVEYFEKYVRPILAEHCYSCHSDRATEIKGGLSLDSSEALLRGGDNGAAIVAGDPKSGTLLAALRHMPEVAAMPPDRQLATEIVDRIETWILRGAVVPNGKFQSKTNASDPELGKSHWAFTKLSKPSIPTSINAAWNRSAIDAYVAHQHDAMNLQPVEDATASELAKRLYLQLAGLLPTQSQIDEFVHQASHDPTATEQLVDRLLCSPRFAERFGRHWLDLARYADSNGLDENFLFREAWRYRNWVIQAINQDMPYDQFLLHQLAGDLLPYESTQQRDLQRIAAGFLLVGPKVLLGNNPENQKLEIADELIETIGKTVLGQTLGCARCHDHKFDPIPTRDYYALAGIFTSTQVMQQRYMLGEQRVMERLVGLGDDGQERNIAYEAFWREQPALKKKLEAAKQVLELLKKGEAQEIEQALKDKTQDFAPAAQDPQMEGQSRLDAQQSFVQELQKQLKPIPIPPRAMIPADAEQPQDEFIRLAGQFTRKSDQVPRGYLQVLCDNDNQLPPPPRDASGRIELSKWLTDPQRRSGMLAARVLANRLWHQLFGTGLVRTVDNFGRTGEAPSHPELLDYLALRIIESNWSIKPAIREIVLSHTFSLSSHHQPLAVDVDPENRYLWRYPRRRLDPESLRDILLQLADELDLTPLDSTVAYLGDQATAVGENKVRRRTDFACRTIYLPVIRNDLPEILSVFDFGDAHSTTGARPKTLVPAQGLFMLNSDLVMDSAEKISKQLIHSLRQSQSDGRLVHSDNSTIESSSLMAKLILQHVLQSQSETPEDVAAISSFWSECLPQEQHSTPIDQVSDEVLLKATSLTCHAVLVSSRFQFYQ